MTQEPPSVALVMEAQASYPPFPYRAAAVYPEWSDFAAGPPNRVWAMLRRLWRLLELDKRRYGTPAWNPLAEIIQPGMTVLLKPNWVRDYNANQGAGVEPLYTHPSVIVAVLPYVLKALAGRGRVILGDAPLQSCNLGKLLADTRLPELVNDLRRQGHNIAIRDFRLALWKESDAAPGDPSGYTLVDLGELSLHAAKDALASRYRVACYQPAAMRRHHGPGRHEYLISNSALDADVIVNLAKLKTHKKTGITGALKNLVGVVGRKEYLPHHTCGGSPGDEYPRPSALRAVHSRLLDARFSPQAERSPALRAAAGAAVELIRRVIGESGCQLLDGSWKGNDTLWRTVLDLNRIVCYYNRQRAAMEARPRKTILTVVDGIVAGEGEGPLAPGAKPLGVMMAGLDSPALDAVMARIAGFEPGDIPLVAEAFAASLWPLTALPAPESISIALDTPAYSAHLNFRELPALGLRPAAGWKEVCAVPPEAREA